MDSLEHVGVCHEKRKKIILQTLYWFYYNLVSLFLVRRKIYILCLVYVHSFFENPHVNVLSIVGK